MELKKVSTEADDDSNDSLDDRYAGSIDPEKSTMNRSAAWDHPLRLHIIMWKNQNKPIKNQQHTVRYVWRN